MGNIEAKVQAAGLWSLGASIGIAVLNAIQNNSQILGTLPPLAQFVILAVVPPTLTFLASYVAAHTPRPDLYNYGPPLEPYLPEPPAPAPEVAPTGSSMRGAYEQQHWAPESEPYYEQQAPPVAPRQVRYVPEQYDTTEWAPVPARAPQQPRRRPAARHQATQPAQ